MSLVAGVKAIKKGFKGVKLNLETGDFFCDPIGKKFVFKILKDFLQLVCVGFIFVQP